MLSDPCVPTEICHEQEVADHLVVMCWAIAAFKSNDLVTAKMLDDAEGLMARK